MPIRYTLIVTGFEPVVQFSVLKSLESRLLYSSMVLSRRDLVDEARDYHLMPERRPLLPSFKIRPRFCNSIAGHIFAIGGLAKSGKVPADLAERHLLYVGKNCRYVFVPKFVVGLYTTTTY